MVQSFSQEEQNVKHMCDVLGVSRSAYYVWRQRRDSPRVLMDRRWRPEVRRVFRAHKRRYGARRVAQELTAQEQPCGRRHRSFTTLIEVASMLEPSIARR